MNATLESIRTWNSGRFTLELFDTGRTDWRGQTRLGYRFTDGERVVFEGADFAGSPLHADDSDATVAALLGFLSLRPGDTDREHFADYTPEQLEWADQNGEELGLLALELEERARNPVPDTYLHVREERSGQEWIVPLADDDPLDLETQIDRWIASEYGGELARSGELMPQLSGDYYARIMTDGNPPTSVVCWESGGFFLASVEEGEGGAE